jgi:hypothetical protein
MGATIVIDWGNLWLVALPVLTSASIAGIFSIFLWRSALKGLPYRREDCEECVYGEELLEKGYCTEPCAVNMIPTLPLVLFIFTATLSILAVFYPSVVYTYLIPFVSSNTTLALYGMLTASCLMSSILLAGYLLQERALDREAFTRVAIVGTLGAIALAPFFQVAAILVPTGLFLVLVALGIEVRARRGKNLLGMTSIGFATLPLFVITLIGLMRILQILRIAGGIL